jgi:DNA polymerase III epsilon subunit-like protein
MIVTGDVWMPDRAVLAKNLVKVMGKLEMPPNYMVFDLETTGVSPSADLIWQFGAFTCTAGKPKHERGVALYVRIPEERALASDFEIKRRSSRLVKNGAQVQESYDRCAREFADEVKLKGKDLATQLKTVVTAMEMCIKEGWPIVGQNCVGFDFPFVAKACKDLGITANLHPEKIVDTGLMIKAAKLKMEIKDGEDPFRFYSRVNAVRARGCFFAIEGFCVPAFKLVEKYGVDTDKAHDAGYDCYLTSLILNELVEWAKGSPATQSAKL